MLKTTSRVGIGAWLCLLLVVLLSGTLAVPSGQSQEHSGGPGRKGVSGKSAYVILSGEFFEALEKLSRSEVVTGDRQEQLLQQIAVAQRFTVRTNLALMEQNEKIIRLLEEIRNQGARAR